MTHDGDKKILAHRAAYISAKGEIPDGLRILHTCDTPACCNPAHLILGTQQDNIADMIKKGRHKANKGEDCHKSKLTTKQVLKIRELYHSGLLDRYQLAKKYKVHKNSIMAIVENKTWKHLLQERIH